MGTIFIPKETAQGETRAAANPEAVKKYIEAGFEVAVQSGAGAKSRITDEDYTAAGAVIAADAKSAWRSADIVAKLHAPAHNSELGANEADLLKPGALLVSFLFPLTNQELVKKLQEAKVTAYAMDMIPRITRAQKMDALSSQSNIGGYKAVLLAADHAPKLFPMLMTAAGTIRPAKVVILGAGVAGLQAIATAKRLGAVVEVSDVRPAVKEQVQSLGASFIEVESEENLEDEGGYAKEASKEFLARQQEVVGNHIAQADVVITTALIPGRPAPKLISEDLVKRMLTGSVVVDMAAEQGGNCALTEPGSTVVKEGVTIVGELNLPASLPVHATEMYAKNVFNALSELLKEGSVALDWEDEVVQGAVITHQGEIRSQRVQEAMAGGGN